MIEMSPAAVVTEVTNMDTSACCSVEDTWRFSDVNSNGDDGDGWFSYKDNHQVVDHI